MNDDSKKRQTLKKQIFNHAQIAKIENIEKAMNFLSSPKRWDLIKRVEYATNFPNIRDAERLRLIICFDYFNWSACNFDQFDPSKGKKLIQNESLFNRVSPEVTSIEETEFCGDRLFFFITEPYFNIVSVETKHRNIDR